MRSWYNSRQDDHATLRLWQHLIRDSTRILQIQNLPCQHLAESKLLWVKRCVAVRETSAVLPWCVSPVRHIPLRPLRSPSAHRHDVISGVMKLLTDTDSRWSWSCSRAGAQPTQKLTLTSTKEKLSPVDETHFSEGDTVRIPLSVFLSTPGLKLMVIQSQTHRPLLPGGTRCYARVWVKKKNNKRRRDGEEFQSKSTAVEEGTALGLQWNLTAPLLSAFTFFTICQTAPLHIKKENELSFKSKARFRRDFPPPSYSYSIESAHKKLKNLGVIAGILLCIKGHNIIIAALFISKRKT